MKADGPTVPDWLLARPIAHRGLHALAAGRCENTLAAADAAAAAGFGVECDVQLTADGEAVVFHDLDLDRLTTERGRVDARNAADLGRLPVGGTADTIPTLAALLDRVGGRVPVTVEIKSRFDGDDRLLRRVAAVIQGRGEPIALKSFDPGIVVGCGALMPDRPRGIVGKSDWSGETRLAADRLEGLATLAHWDETRPDFISWRGLDLPDAEAVAERRRAGTPVVAWTVRSPREAAAALEGADQIVFEGFLPA